MTFLIKITNAQSITTAELNKAVGTILRPIDERDIVIDISIVSEQKPKLDPRINLNI